MIYSLGNGYINKFDMDLTSFASLLNNVKSHPLGMVNLASVNDVISVVH